MGTGLVRAGRWALVAWGLCAVNCHEPDVRQVQATAVFEAPVVDFGVVPVGEWREASIGVRNAGYVPFEALAASALNGNPYFRVVMDGPIRVPPGETRPIRVRFHPLREVASSETVSVSTDAENQPRLPVLVKGSGGPTPVKFSPTLLDFQTLETDSDRTLSVVVENPADVPLTLALAGPNAALFDADAVVVPPSGKIEVHARFHPHAVGQSGGRLEARACDGCTPASAALTGRAVASAFSFDPAPVAFDSIPVHEATQSGTRATNIIWRPVTFSKLSTSDPAFAPLLNLSGTVVNPGDGADIPMQFSARTSGPTKGTLTVSYTSDRPRTEDVGLDATGGKPTLALAPVAIDFGSLPVGGKVERIVRLSNAGTAGSIQLVGAQGNGDVAQFNLSNPFRAKAPIPWDPGSAWPNLSSPGIGIAPGNDFVEVGVYFEPTAAGTFNATIAFLSNDRFNPQRILTVTGTAYSVPPCSYRLLPAALNFGNVPAGHGAVLGFRFENAATTDCAVKDIHISNDGGGVFWMPGGPLTGGVVRQNDAFAAQIAFRAGQDGTYDGELQLTVSNPSQPQLRVPIHAVAIQTCLTATPNFLDFGAVRYDCATQPRTTFVSNQCPALVNVSAAWIDAGTSDQFSLLSPPPLPETLAPGQGFELTVSFARALLGQHFSPLFIQAQGEPASLLIPLLGEVNHEGIQIDRFVQGHDGQLDVLFVVSNTTTAGPYQDRLKAAIPSWLDRAKAAGVDLHLGVTTTGLATRNGLCPGGAQGGEAGRLFPVDNSLPRIISGADPNAAPEIQADLTVGQCHNLVQGLETMRSALSPPLVDHPDDPRTLQPNDGNLGFLRDTARLAVVFLADEDDHSGFDPTSYIQFLQALKGPNLAQRTNANAIVPTDASCQTAGPPGPRFASVARGTGGQVLSVCAGDYSSLLDPMSQRAAVAQRSYKLSAQPTRAADIQVLVDGTAQGAGQWTYDGANNAIVFGSQSVPNPGQLIEARYHSVCAVNP